MRRSIASLALLCSLGCVGEDLPPITEVPRVVPLDVPQTALTAACRPLAGASVLSVSPEGDLWLARAAGAETELTVIDADGGEQTYTESRPIDAATALSATQLAFVSGGVFIRTGDYVDSLPWPAEASRPRGICGDPRLDRDGFVLADDLFQRAGGEWWRWRPAMSAFGTIESVPENLGACRGERGESWLVASSGLWRVSDRGLERVEGLPAARDVAFGPRFGAAALTDEGLFFGPERWEHTAFEAGPPTAIAAAGDTVYAAAGARLYRFDADGVEELSVADVGAVDAIRPYASGLWIESGDAVCQVALDAATVRVRGLRPWMRRGVGPLSLDVRGPAGALSVRRDGEMVHEQPAFAGATEILGVEGGPAGWHTLRIDVVGATSAAREIRYEVVHRSGATYEDDIAPLFAAHCAGSECHGADRDDATRPDLSTYEGWVESATTIRNRVGVTADMPPLAERAPSWDSEEATLIVAWIDEGMVSGR